MKQRGDQRTLDIFADWHPPVVQHDPEKVRSATFRGKLARAVSLTLTECGIERAEIAVKMSEYLGSDVSENMLNAYASESREEHNISTERLHALCVVTGDWRPIAVLIDGSDKALIERRYLAAVEDAMAREEEEWHRTEAERCNRIARAARRKWSGR